MGAGGGGHTYIWTDGLTDIHMDGWTDRQTYILHMDG